MVAHKCEIEANATSRDSLLLFIPTSLLRPDGVPDAVDLDVPLDGLDGLGRDVVGHHALERGDLLRVADRAEACSGREREFRSPESVFQFLKLKNRMCVISLIAHTSEN